MKRLIALGSLVLVFASCQKVIDVNLNEAAPQVVIESNYYASGDSVVAKLSYTSNYFSNEDSEKIANASVTITDPQGVPTVLNNAGNGRYDLFNYTPQYNGDYNLEVQLDGVTYSANSFLNDVTPLDSLPYQFIPQSIFGDSGYVLSMSLTDPIDEANYWRAIRVSSDTVNDNEDEIFLFDDEFVNGNVFQIPFFADRYAVGDTIFVELRSLDRVTYDYYTELISVLGGNSAAPTNPTTNWNNNALGYFAAWGRDTLSVVIEE
ncbi:DUF4249 family protein [Lishizhenia sp.]|uniref:DUF4249 family protein n=1 Tax=Lishizhenia sp. TaxID=2497594 RepID=UPI00299EF410|nr:DUF4249 family protein [Lishizhenia sp.]MDX1446269.1 DUF4249 family protein [Lishizhenia sp.]